MQVLKVPGSGRAFLLLSQAKPWIKPQPRTHVCQVFCKSRGRAKLAANFRSPYNSQVTSVLIRWHFVVLPDAARLDSSCWTQNGFFGEEEPVRTSVPGYLGRLFCIIVSWAQ
jgi:hypothetical protein